MHGGASPAARQRVLAMAGIGMVAERSSDQALLSEARNLQRSLCPMLVGMEAGLSNTTREAGR
jgi:hypothetical protein